MRLNLRGGGEKWKEEEEEREEGEREEERRRGEGRGEEKKSPITASLNLENIFKLASSTEGQVLPANLDQRLPWYSA